MTESQEEANTRLYDALTEKDFDAAKAAIAGGADVNGIVEGMPLICLITLGEHVEALDFLIKNGANVEARFHDDGKTALLIAATYSRGDEAQALLNKLMDGGAAVNAVDKYGQNAIDWAARAMRGDVVQRLINEGTTVSHVAREAVKRAIARSEQQKL